MRKISVAERQARLARRHHVAPAHRASTVDASVRGVVCLHATDPATMYLSAHARVATMAVGDLERSLYAKRSLVKHLAMRRTLFVIPRDRIATVQAAASARVAVEERRRLSGFVERGGLHKDGARWLARASAQVLEVLADGRTLSWTELRKEAPLLEGAIPYAQDKKWGGVLPVGPRVLTALSAAGEIVRASNLGPWTTSKPGWASMSHWLGGAIQPQPARDALAALVDLWLGAFGPGTDKDLAWWLGSPLTPVRRALADIGAVAVDLDGRTGYVRADDVGEAPPVASWVALLPGLDPTPMGWIERDWFLGPHKPHVFDRNGNVGPTVWCDGRIVGGWRQQPDGTVEVQLLEAVGRAPRAAIKAEAARLTTWLKGRCIRPRFPSPLCRPAAR